MKQTQPRGFTLVAMLIVLAIIGVLAAILLPVVARVRATAHTTVCASNLRQIGLAMTLYANDHNRYYPPAIEVAPVSKCGWVAPLEPYVKDVKMFTCPAADAPQVGSAHYSGDYHSGCPGPDKSISDDGTFEEYDYYGSYDITTYKDSANYTRHIRDDSFPNPSTTGYILDGRGLALQNSTWTWIQNDGSRIMHGLPRHNDGANVMFADMHVKWLGHDSLDKPGLWSFTGPT